MSSNSGKRSDSIAIVGCGGFIGSHLIDSLLAATPYRIVGIDIVSAKIGRHLDNDRFTFVNADMHDTAAVRPWIEQCGTAVFLAAICTPSLYTTKPLAVIDVNCTGTIPLVSLCAQAGTRLVYFSTSEVYGRTAASAAEGEDEAAHLLREEESPFILGPVAAQRWSYACAKQLVERYIYACGQERRLDYTIVRPFNFIGPRMDFVPGIDGEGIPRVLACFLSALLKGEPLKLVDGGKNRRCFTYIDDAVEAIVKIIGNPRRSRGHIFNIGNPANEITIADLALLMTEIWRRIVPEACEKEILIEPVPAAGFYGPGYEDSGRRLPDISKARTILGWEPRTGLETALTSTIRAFVDRYRPAVRKG